MARAFLVAALTAGLLTIPGGGAAKPADREKDDPPLITVERLVRSLHTVRVTYDKDLTTTPFKEVRDDLSRVYRVTFVVNKTAFENPEALDDARATKLSATRVDDFPLATFLGVYLRGLGVENVTYLVRPDHVEITTRAAAEKETGLLEALDEAKASGEPGELVRAKARLTMPLVCVAVENRALGAALADLSRVYGLNVVVEPGAREQMKTPLTERLLNVPADTALELLAGQAGLSVVRKGNTFRVTGGGGAQ